MTTVSAGATGTYTLTGAQTIAIDVAANEQAQAIVTRAGVQIYGDTVRSSTVIGPFLTGDVLTLTAQRGDVDYTVATYTGSHIDTIDAAESTALQALVSGGGIYRPTISLLGDSITNLQNVGTTAVYRYLNAEGYFNWANALAGNKFTVVRYSGVSGNTLQDMIDRFATDIAPYPSKYVSVMGGVNDIALGVSLATMLSRLDTLVGLINALGRTPIIAIPTAMGSMSATQRRVTYGFRNGILSRMAAGALVAWDAFAPTVDPTSTTCAPRANVNYDSGTTNLHPSNMGAYWIGKKLAVLLNQLEPTIPSVAGYEDYANAQNSSGTDSNFLDNPTFQGTAGTTGSGTWTGTPPAGFNALASAAVAVTCNVGSQTDPDTGLSIGNYVEFVCTFAAAANNVILKSTDWAARVAGAGVGAQFVSEATVQVVTPGVIRNIRLDCQSDTGAGESSYWGQQNQTAQTLPEAIVPMRIATNPTIIQGASPVIFNWQLNIQSNAAGTGTVRVWLPRLKRVS